MAWKDVIPKSRTGRILVGALLVTGLANVGYFVLGHGDPEQRLVKMGFVVVALVVSTVTLFAFYRYLKAANKKFEPQLEAMRQEAWMATVTGRERKAVRQVAGNHGWGSEYLVVYYRRDDGREGNVMQYQGNSMDSIYAITPGLEMMVDAPRYEVLETWQEGDRLEKRAGQYFPQKVVGADNDH